MPASFSHITRQLPLRAIALVLLCSGVGLGEPACSSTPDKQPTEVKAPKKNRRSTPFSLNPTTRQLAVFHISDMESELIDLQNNQTWKRELKRGGAARLHSLLTALQKRTQLPTLTVAGGDTFMPAPTLHLEIDGKNAVNTALNHLDLHASALGNHEFDLGEEYLAEFIQKTNFPYLSATLDIRGGPLLPLTIPKEKLTPNNTWLEKNAGRILPRGKVCLNGKIKQTKTGARFCQGGLTVGLVGATTERLRILSRLSDHIIIPNTLKDVRDRIQEQVTALEQENVDLIFLLSHLQGIHRELQLLDHGLTGVDVVLAGGGDNRLADKGDRLLPGESPDPLCLILDGECYPMIRTDANGNPVVFVATGGQMRYVGQLMVGFDADGILTGFQLQNSRPWPVDEVSILELGAKTDPSMYTFHQNLMDILAPRSTPFAHAEFFLDGTRESVRNHETNLGSLSADAMAWAARRSLPNHTIAMAIRNGGGIRAPIGAVDPKSERLIGGDIRPIDIQSAFRFDNPVVMVEITHRTLVETLESSLRGVGTSQGRFPQVSKSVNLTYTTRAPEQTHLMSNGRIRKILCPGYRVRNLTLKPPGEDPIKIVYDGKILTPKEKLKIATLAYLAGGGDAYFPRSKRKLKTTPVMHEGQAIGEQSSLTGFIQTRMAIRSWNNGAEYTERDPRRPETFERMHDVNDPVTLPPEGEKRCNTR